MEFWSLRSRDGLVSASEGGAGCVGYSEVADLQRELVEKRARDEIPDTILFLEHRPVVTRGRGLQWTGAPRERSIPLAAPLPPSIEFAESERGGDLTYHGPGQLVVYPVCKLDGSGFWPSHDVTGFLRRLEKIFVGWLDEVALEPGFRAQSRENATGVWIEKPNAASLEAAKKIASIGIAVKKWVTYHGIAINIVNDLSPFRLISPCGFSPDVMTSLETLLGAAAFNRKYGQDSWRSKIETELAQRFYSCDTGAEREVETDAEIDTGRDLGRNPGRDLKIQEVWV